jgi:1-acyl-sn-glycerol-3-phosphate acyltransferase
MLVRWEPVRPRLVPRRALFLAAPHTSNWDAFYMLLSAYALGLRVSWVGKKSLFKSPLFGWFLARLGGIAIDRSGGQDTVAAIAAIFDARDSVYLGIAPSGTRRLRDYWKSGFYHIAQAADVPVICGFLDYANRRGGAGPTIEITGDLAADMDEIRAFYATVTGRRPENTSPVRLRSEEP